MKIELKMSFLLFLVLLIGACNPKGKGKKKRKCNECPTWGYHQESQEKFILEEKA